MEQQLFATLQKLNEDELLIFIGNELFPDEIRALTLNPKKIKEKAEDWINSKYEFFKEQLCSNTSLKEIIKSDSLEKSALIMHVMELIGNIHDSKITIYAIAVYFVNFGYKNLCYE